jgi:type III secretory pathway component EscT
VLLYNANNNIDMFSINEMSTYRHRYELPSYNMSRSLQLFLDVLFYFGGSLHAIQNYHFLSYNYMSYRASLHQISTQINVCLSGILSTYIENRHT